jgi:hypothetical protein
VTDDPATDLDLDLTGELVRPYVITNGRDLPSDKSFSVITLVTAAEGARDTRVLAPEARHVLELCSGGFLSVVEVAGHTRLPLGVVRILLADLAESGLLTTRAPISHSQRTDEKLLNNVLIGLKARFGA